MRFLFLTLTVVLFFLPSNTSYAIPKATEAVKKTTPVQTIRVVTYNIHHGVGMDGKLDLSRIAKVIASQKPDIVALQEVDRKTTRTNRIDQAAELARLLKMESCFGSNLSFQGGGYGNAILSKGKILSSKNKPIPQKDQSEKRGYLVAEIQLSNLDFTIQVISAHLDHGKKNTNRISAYTLMKAHLQTKTKAKLTILAGDFNANPESETIQRFSQDWKLSKGKELASYPANKPTTQIDYIMVARNSKIIKSQATGQKNNRLTAVATVVKEPLASDHRPMLSVIYLSPKNK